LPPLFASQALSFLKAQGVSHPYLQASHVGITQNGHPVLQNMVGALSCRIANKGDGSASLTAPVRDIVAAAAAAVGSAVPLSATDLQQFPALCMLSPEALAVILSAPNTPLSSEQADLSAQASFLAGQLLYRIVTGRPPLAEYPWRYVRSEGGATSISYEAAWMAPLPAQVPPPLAQTVTALLAPLPSQRLPIEVAVRSFAQMGAAGIGVPPPLPLVARLLLLTVQATSTPLHHIKPSAAHSVGQAELVPGIPPMRVPVPVWPSDTVGAVVHRAVHLVGLSLGSARPDVRLVLPSAPHTGLQDTLASVADVVFSRPHCFVGPGSVAEADSKRAAGSDHALHSVGVVYVTLPLFSAVSGAAADSASASAAAAREASWSAGDGPTSEAQRNATNGSASPALSQLNGSHQGSPGILGSAAVAVGPALPSSLALGSSLQLPTEAPPAVPSVPGLQVGGGSGLSGSMGMDFNLGGGFDMFGGFGGGFGSSFLGGSAGVDGSGGLVDSHDSALARSALGDILDDDETDAPPALPLDLDMSAEATHEAVDEGTAAPAAEAAATEQPRDTQHTHSNGHHSTQQVDEPGTAAPGKGTPELRPTQPVAPVSTPQIEVVPTRTAAATSALAQEETPVLGGGSPDIPRKSSASKPSTGGWASIAKRAADRPPPEPRAASVVRVKESGPASPVMGAVPAAAAGAGVLPANPLGADLSWRTLGDEDLAYEIERRCGLALSPSLVSKQYIRLGNLRDGLRDMQDRTHTRDEVALLKFASQGYIEACLGALALGRAKDPSTASYALQTVSNLAMQTEVRQIAAEKGVIEAIVGAMQAYPAAGRVLKDAVVALRHMAYENDDNKVRMATSGAVAQVITSMTLCKESAQVQRQCCGALSIFAVHSSKGDVAKICIVTSGGVGAILSAIQLHLADAGVVVAALKALGTLVHMPAARQAALDAGAEAVCAEVKASAESRGSKQLLDVLRQTQRRLGQTGSGASSGASSVVAEAAPAGAER